MISILVDSIPSIEISYNQGIIKSLLTAVFTKERIAAADLNLIFCDDEFLSDMKKRFFGVSQWTDVIAFRLNDEDKSNIEGEIIDKLQEVGFSYDGIILNAAAYTHTSVGIGDAIRAIETSVIEVHISNTHSREEFRHFSYITPVAKGVIMGFGLQSYELAIQSFL